MYRFLLLISYSLAVPIVQEDFETPESLGAVFNVVDVIQPGVGWSWQLWDFGSTGAAQVCCHNIHDPNSDDNVPTGQWIWRVRCHGRLVGNGQAIEYGLSRRRQVVVRFATILYRARQ